MRTLAQHSGISIGRRLAVMACTALLAAGALAPQAAWAQKKEQQVSAKLFEKLGPAQDALKKREYATALSLSREALPVAKTAYERELTLRMIYNAALGAQNFQEVANAIEQLSQMESVSAAEKLSFKRTLGQIYEQMRQYDRAISNTKDYIKGSGGTPKDWELLYRVYAVQNNCPDSLAALEKVLGGKAADENQLKWQQTCYYKSKDTVKRLPVLEELVRRFPKKDYFTSLLTVYELEQKLDERALLNVLRWGFERDVLSRDVDYTEYAEFALNAGSSFEAQRALDRGTTKGVLKKADPSSKLGRLLDSTKRIAAEDKNKVVQLDKEARAGKNGESDVVLGMQYYGAGEYAKAAEALQRGLQADRVAKIKRVDDANMLLGIVQWKLKKRADADKAFGLAKADPRMAKAAGLWLGAA
jgi:tetratricopeptide (TPR) repeat protein